MRGGKASEQRWLSFRRTIFADHLSIGPCRAAPFPSRRERRWHPSFGRMLARSAAATLNVPLTAHPRFLLRAASGGAAAGRAGGGSRAVAPTADASHEARLNKFSSRITQPKAQGASQAMLYATGLRPTDMCASTPPAASLPFRAHARAAPPPHSSPPTCPPSHQSAPLVAPVPRPAAAKAQVGIASVWYDGNPCNMHLLGLATKVGALRARPSSAPTASHPPPAHTPRTFR